MQQSTQANLVSDLIANLLVAAIGITAFVLWSFAPDTYYIIVQEDEVLEWSTFWAFICAGGIYLYVAARPGFSLTASWFPIGLLLFCLFVALEEISWGQRLFGYRPPEYFLQFNYQQEFNLHNVIATSLRKLSVVVVIFGYGVALPLLGLIPAVRQLIDRIGILSPPPILIPAFLLTGIMQQIYPFKFTGEWIEMMLGACFLFAALAEARLRSAATASTSTSFIISTTGTTLVILLAGWGSALATNHLRSADPANVTAAQFELKTLRKDFTSGNVSARRCGFHRRIFTFTEKTGQSYLYNGAFANLAQQGLPEQRAEFFLDPWNYAYWIRDNCAANGRSDTTYLYSFGPNRRRDSTRWEIRGDDIAIVLNGAIDDFRIPTDPR
ncbi:MAG: hypothetical protein QGH93_10435 [Gammaproteobacteria bacterium]|jgi:hypothetical protein|nr:hypothetical protein [Chromatiales bacterium]MDP6675245.1 hypothetical protein [Gammaproteobacteria bacterium]